MNYFRPPDKTTWLEGRMTTSHPFAKMSRARDLREERMKTDYTPQAQREIQGWTDQKIVDELRNTMRATIPETWLPLLVEAVARILSREPSTMDPQAESRKRRIRNGNGA